MTTSADYLVHCWNCLGEFDALGAVWCGCSSIKPTKVCPFCMSCFCAADRVYIEHFWEAAPRSLKQERAGLGHARQRLGDLLIHEGAITETQLMAALERRSSTGERIGEALVSLGALTQADLERYLKIHKGSFSADLSSSSIRPHLIQMVGVDYCYQHAIIPLELQDIGDRPILTLAMADTSQGEVVEAVGTRVGCRVIPEFAERDEILEVLRNTFPREEKTAGTSVREIRRHLFDWIGAAVKQRASHIHVSTERMGLKIFLRIDGVVYLVDEYAKKYHPYLMREVRRLVHHPEGRPFSRGKVFIKVDKRRYQLTVGVRDTEHGEDVAVRVVDTHSFGRDLLAEVPDVDVRAAIVRAISNPGLTVIGSPLYHGRIDTAYSLLWAEQQTGRSPKTLERTITCPLPDVDQEELPPSGVGAALGQSNGGGPVFLMDLLSSLNCTEVFEAARSRPVIVTAKTRGIVPTLSWLQERVDPETLASTLRLLTSQRQARKICDGCRVEDKSDRQSVYLGLDQASRQEFQPQKGSGCSACEGRGYRGRTTLYEYLPIGERISNLMLTGGAPEVIFQDGVESEGSTLRMAFFNAVSAGQISLAEFEKVAL